MGPQAESLTVQTAAAAKRVRRTRPRRRSALPIRPLRCTAWGPSRWDNSGDAEMARSLWSRAHAALLVGFARVCSERAHLCGFCLELTPATSAPGLGLTPPTLSAPGLGSPRPHCLHRDWGSPLPHRHRDWVHPAHICCVAGARRSRIGTGTVVPSIVHPYYGTLRACRCNP